MGTILNYLSSQAADAVQPDGLMERRGKAATWVVTQRQSLKNESHLDAASTGTVELEKYNWE